RTDHAHPDGVPERDSAVRQAGTDHADLAGAHGELLRAVLTEPEMHRPLEHVRDLLVLVRVPRHLIILLEIDMGDHHALARDHSPRDRALEGLGRELIPAVMGYGGGARFHRRSPRAGLKAAFRAGSRSRAPGSHSPGPAWET